MSSEAKRREKAERDRMRNFMVDTYKRVKRERGAGFAAAVEPYKAVIERAMRANHESNPLIAFMRIVEAGQRQQLGMGGAEGRSLLVAAAVEMAEHRPLITIA